jgi:NDP-sugar pyrophosphorylase family protein
LTQVKQCLILAAGNGTRLRPVSGGLPKPLVHFRGKPILEHVIVRARKAGIEKFVIVVGYRSDRIPTITKATASPPWPPKTRFARTSSC